jgi:hypothetical protein
MEELYRYLIDDFLFDYVQGSRLVISQGRRFRPPEIGRVTVNT